MLLDMMMMGAMGCVALGVSTNIVSRFFGDSSAFVDTMVPVAYHSGSHGTFY